MKNILKIALGIVTSIGGFLEAGSLSTALQAGAAFRYELLWAVAAGTICIAFLTEMSGRLAAVSHHTVTGAMRKRFGVSLQIWPLATQILIDVLVLACEIGGAAFALELATGVSMSVWAVPVSVALWVLLWRGTFGAIENGVALLGLVTLAFPVAAILLRPDWAEAARSLVPHRPSHDAGRYAYLAVGILGATISPYLVTFYSSGAVEEKWEAKDLAPNRLVAAIGMAFGSSVSMMVIIVAAEVLAPQGIFPQTFRDAAHILTGPLGPIGFWLFCGSLFIACAGAALEIALDVGYIISQSFGWDWGENKTPSQGARFAMVFTGAIALATLPSLAGIDPLTLTMFAMALTVVALPITLAPLIVIMNDTRFLETHTNGWIANAAVITIVVLSFVLAIVAIPAQVMGGG